MNLRRKVLSFLYGNKLLRKGERLAIAVSGGKDSMVLAHLLRGLKPLLIHINMGIGEYSEASESIVRDFAKEHRLPLKIYRLRDAWGMSIDEMAHKLRKAPCSVCGTIRRYYQNRIAVENECVLATGHTLDDTASFLVYSLTTGRIPYIAPLLPEGKNIARKIKPLFYITESEIIAYANENQITYVNIHCPFEKAPAREIRRALQFVEAQRPGSLKTLVKTILKLSEPQKTEPVPCKYCGMPSYNGVCSVCKIRLRLGLDPEEPVGSRKESSSASA